MTEAEWEASEDPGAILDWHRRTVGFGGGRGAGRSLSNRKLRLFAATAARLRPDCRLGNLAWLESIRIAEAVADGAPMPEDRPRTAIGTDLGPTCADAIDAARAMCSYTTALSRPEAHLLRDIIGSPFRPVTTWNVILDGIKNGTDRGDRLDDSWLNGTVASLANAAYDRRDEQTGHLDPFRLNLLADALEEAGCPQEVECPECKGVGLVDVGLADAQCRCADYDTVWRVDSFGLEYHAGRGRLPHPVLAHLRSPGPHVRGCWAIDLLTGKE